MRYKNLKSYKILVVFAIIIVGGVISFLVVRANPDYVSDTFTDETKIGKGTEKVEIATTTGQVKLAECYSPNPSWTKVADTIVRDIAGAYNATTSKDIYCDNYNCILWTDGAATPTTPCIATDSNVYANLLWSKTNSTSQTWCDYFNFSISGGDIGGTHPSELLVGNNGINVGTKNWLEKYYSSVAGMFNAMDVCKTKGSGWRLPNILELDSIRDQAKGSSPYSRLPGITANYYWSSTEQSDAGAYYMSFDTGNVNLKNKGFTYYVRCVRGQ